jgi:hypothetical protein
MCSATATPEQARIPLDRSSFKAAQEGRYTSGLNVTNTWAAFARPLGHTMDVAGNISIANRAGATVEFAVNDGNGENWVRGHG